MTMDTRLPTRIDRIVITGDLLRPGPALQSGWQNRYIAAFHAALAPILQPAFKIPVDRVLAESGGPFDPAIFYTAMGRAFTLEEWLTLFADVADIGPDMERLLIAPFTGSLVIGFELPGIMRRLFRDHAIPCVDLSFGPLQFLDDTTLTLRSHDRAIMDRLCRFNLTEDMLAAAAGILKATAICAPLEERSDGPAILFCASTATDRNLYGDRRFVTFLDYADEIRALAAGYRTVYFKPHPYGFCTAEEVAFFRQLPGIRFTTANVYWMMSALDELDAVVSLCSSASLEARYFGKRGINLLRPPALLHQGQESHTVQEGACISVLGEIWSGRFWQTILEPFIPPATGQTVELPPKPNRLRNIFWAFGPASLIDLLPQSHSLDSYLKAQSRSIEAEHPEDPVLIKARKTVRAAFENNDFSTAIDLASSSHPGFSEDPTLLFYLALSHAKQGETLEKALALMDRALSQGCDSFWGHFQRAYMRIAAGDRAGALADLEKSHALKPEHPGLAKILDDLRKTAD